MRSLFIALVNPNKLRLFAEDNKKKQNIDKLLNLWRRNYFF